MGSEDAPKPGDIPEYQHPGWTAHGEVVTTGQRGERIAIVAPERGFEVRPQLKIGGQAGTDHRDPRPPDHDCAELADDAAAEQPRPAGTMGHHGIGLSGQQTGYGRGRVQVWQRTPPLDTTTAAAITTAGGQHGSRRPVTTGITVIGVRSAVVALGHLTKLTHHRQLRWLIRFRVTHAGLDGVVHCHSFLGAHRTGSGGPPG
ncbi:MAG: hypothetical protein ACRDSZ_18050 [Pseudonocardiaceae bacterium]